MTQLKTVVDTESHIRNDVPPRAVANSDKEISSLRQTTKAESSNPAMTQTATTTTWQPGTDSDRYPHNLAPRHQPQPLTLDPSTPAPKPAPSANETHTVRPTPAPLPHSPTPASPTIAARYRPQQS